MTLISVIVPVYNIEKYLRQCLDSLAAQTMEEIEIIVVDDGSTDKSGLICDEYSRDERFRVFHTENRGLSAARNFGIDHANSEWIMFVDGDDWVDERFCEVPYKAIAENDVDLVLFNAITVTKKGKTIKKKRQENTPTGVITREEAIDYGGSVAWNKLYKKCLFTNIRYPEGHVYEDIATTYKIVYQAKQIFRLKDVLYYYRYRNDSITHTKINPWEKDHFSFCQQRFIDLIYAGYPEKKEKERLQIAALRYCFHVRPSDDYLYQKAEEILSEINKVPKQWHQKQKIMFFVWKNSKHIFHLLCKISGKQAK